LEGQKGGGVMSGTPHMSMPAIISRYSQHLSRENELDGVAKAGAMTKQELDDEIRALSCRREVLAYRASRLRPADATEALFLLGLAFVDFDVMACSELATEQRKEAMEELARRCLYRVRDWMIDHGGNLPKPILSFLLSNHLDPEQREALSEAA
jgi:hypothetical protein